MGGNKFGSYIVNYRSKRKEAAEDEKRKRVEELGRRPQIIDPSFELLGYQSEQHGESLSQTNSVVSHQRSEDWIYQTRRANITPEQYQFEPYCDVKAKSSTSSNASKASTAPSQQDYDMGWDSAKQTRPRPQSYLPVSITETKVDFMEDFSRASTYQSRRHTMQPSQLPLTTASLPKITKPAYKLEASLTRPFSIDDPLEFLTEPVGDSHLYASINLSVVDVSDSRKDERKTDSWTYNEDRSMCQTTIPRTV